MFLSRPIRLYRQLEDLQTVCFQGCTAAKIADYLLHTTIKHEVPQALVKREQAYNEKFPDWVVADLNQNAEKRPKYGETTVPTLTTGCSRLRWKPGSRFLHGPELLLLHGVPTTRQIATIMRTRMVNVSCISHRAQCMLAGNSMHASSVGFMIMASALFAGQ